MVNTKATTCFSYIPTTLTNALPGAQWIMDMGTGNGYAASIGPVMKPFTSTILIIFHPSKGSMLIRTFRMLRLPVPFMAGEL